MHARLPLLALALLVVAAPAVEAQNVGSSPNFGDLRLKESFLPDPQSVTVTSGGNIAVSKDDCSYGHVSDAPDVDLYYTTSGGSSLYIYVEGDGDTMLLVNTPGGEWVCDDDSHGDLDPLLSFPSAEDGLYDIWVGSYSDENLPATLYVSELDPGNSSSSGEAPDPGAQPTFGRVELTGGFRPDPHAISLRAGGSIEVDISGCSYGHVAEAPDVDLYYTVSGGRDLYIYVDGDEDTTLLVNQPDGSWICDDDGYGNSNPILAIPKAPGGLYDIWVGTYGDDLTDATLYITEVDPR